MKRFTGTEKWLKPWFRDAPPRLKCLWAYILDNCDCAGIWDVDWKLASFMIGEPINEQEAMDFLKGQTLPLAKGKLWVMDFVDFQFGKLSSGCKPHANVIARLQQYDLLGRVGTRVGTRVGATLQEKEEEKEEEKEKEKEKEKGEYEGDGAPPAVEPPRGFPKTEPEALASAEFVGVPAAFASTEYNRAVGRGYKDAKGHLIHAWPNFIKACHDTNRCITAERKLNQPPRGGAPDPDRFTAGSRDPYYELGKKLGRPPKKPDGATHV